MGDPGITALAETSAAVDRVELVGELSRSLDDRGRLSIPTAFRDVFAHGVVILKWPGPCVAVMPVEAYREMEDSMRAKQRAELSDGRAREALNALGNHTRLDASGRVFIPESLREFAGFDRELRVVGQRTRLELWHQERHDADADLRWAALQAHIAAEAL